MKNASLTLKILYGLEAIISARVLLFTIPVIIARKTSDLTFPYSVGDWMVLVFTYCSILYLAASIAAFLGHKKTKLLHYIVALVVLLLNAFLLKFITNRGGEPQLIHYAPLIFSMAITACVALIKKPGEKRGGGWQSILVVDDDEMYLKTVRPMLVREGFAVLTATTGESGFDVALKHKPDLIILDVILPGIKGRDLCKKLKDHNDTKDIPIVFLTAKFSEDDVKAELEAGAVAHLTKPIDPKALVSTINKILHPKK